MAVSNAAPVITGAPVRPSEDGSRIRPARPSAAEDVAARRAARVLDPRLAGAEETVRGQRVRISGHLDVHSVPDVRAALHHAVDDGQGDLVVELGDVVIGDATGLGVLVGAHRRAQRRGRRLVLAGVTLPTLRLLRVTKLHRVLTLAETRPEEAGTVDGAVRPPSPAEAAVRAERLRRARSVVDRTLGGSGAQNSRAVGSSMPRKAS